MGSAGYELPFGEGRKFLNDGGIVNAIAGGWSLSPSFSFAAGFLSRSRQVPARVRAALMFRSGPTWLRVAPVESLPLAPPPIGLIRLPMSYQRPAIRER